MKISKLVGYLVSAAILNAASGLVCAGGFPEKSGYLIDERGNIVRNSYGECWHTGYWTPALAIAECDPVSEKDPPIPEKQDKQQEEHKEAQPSPAPLAPRAIDPPAISEKPAAMPDMPAPVPVPEKPAAAPEKPVLMASFRAETLFDFDKAVLKPEGRKALEEEIVASMKMHPEVKLLLVTGHTDRIGKKKYNQRLSERRANAVKAYLVKNGVAAERIKAIGKGKAEPNPQANTKQVCKGVRGKKLIACLQPDRRVTIESESK